MLVLGWKEKKKEEGNEGGKRKNKWTKKNPNMNNIQNVKCSKQIDELLADFTPETRDAILFIPCVKYHIFTI